MQTKAEQRLKTKKPSLQSPPHEIIWVGKKKAPFDPVSVFSNWDPPVVVSTLNIAPRQSRLPNLPDSTTATSSAILRQARYLDDIMDMFGPAHPLWCERGLGTAWSIRRLLPRPW